MNLITIVIFYFNYTSFRQFKWTSVQGYLSIIINLQL